MRKTGLIILLCWLFAIVQAANTIDIPLTMSVIQFAPTDNPTGSTPDPTDPNQFRASLTGNTLLIETQKEAVSYVVIRTDFSESKNEDYFYSVSFDSISCPVTQTGTYVIQIGYWNTDFIGVIRVEKIILCDFNGKLYDYSMLENKQLPTGWYILRVVTNLGTTATKFIRRE